MMILKPLAPWALSLAVAGMLLSLPGCGGSASPGPGSAEAAPVIVAQPSDAEVDEGRSATLSVEATGGGSLSYQWARKSAITAPSATLNLSDWTQFAYTVTGTTERLGEHH